jgi:hypothetical protein
MRRARPFAAGRMTDREASRHGLWLRVQFLAIALVAAPTAWAGAPCCTVTGIDAHSAIVTAKDKANGRPFKFHVTNRSLLRALRVGAPVYANFARKQVSLDGRSACCRITALGSAPLVVERPVAPAPAPRLQAPAAGALPQATTAVPRPAANPAAPCCAIIAIDARSASVSAKENASGRLFQFHAANAASLRVGAPVYANFSRKQVSLDGRSACCAITAIGAAPLAPHVRPQALVGYRLPSVTYGTPRPLTRQDLQARRFPPSQGNIVRLNGRDAIRAAQDLPQGARDLLILHARSLEPGESEHYIVNRQLAEEWMRAHPAPADAKELAKKSEKKSSTCHGVSTRSISANCAKEAAKHAQDEVTRQWRKEWRHVSEEYAHDLHMAEDCLADKTLRPVGDVPVRFSLPIEFPLSAEKGGSSKNSHGSASGTVKGSVTVGVPLDADFKASVELFYIPCLPFAVRPKSLSATGELTVSARLGATLNATGQFNELFTIPPTGGPKIPVEVIPIVIAGVPVAEMDVSVYLDGTVEIGGDGALDGHFLLNAPYKTAFDFNCSGKSCGLNAHNVPVPTTTSEDAQLKGQVHVKPAIYAALQLDFDWDALSARAGPQPYLWGQLNGCTAAAASQSTSGQSSAQGQYALAADLDWAIELRAEALVAGKKVAERLVKVPGFRDRKHIWYGDLAPPGPDNAMSPGVAGTTEVAAGQPAAFTLKMRQCYPYQDDVQYRVTWNGGATASSNTPAARPGPALVRARGTASAANSPCVWQAGQATCWANPQKNMVLNLAWPTAGQYTVTVAPVGDRHPRRFEEQGTQLSVSVH